MAANAMNVLVLGGTRFVGRHVVDRLVERGHRVVRFHRGQTGCGLPRGVQERLGDRNADLSALDTECWDAIVDLSCYRPEQLARSLELRAQRYLFVSTVSVYRDLSVRGITEEAPTIEDFDPADEAAAYGGNKAACERLLWERRPRDSVVLRPGLIAGRWDGTGRFTYWCERFLRGGRVLAPGAPSRPVQFVDAVDVARFSERALSSNYGGVFNVVGPSAPATMGQLLDECAAVAQQLGAPPSTVAWGGAAFLREHGVEQWIEMPLWLDDPSYAGMLEIDNAKAVAAGLQTRPIAETIRDVMEWTSATDVAACAGISPEREAELLASLSAPQAG